MYKKFFGFTELPFQLVPNPVYLYLSKSHEEALAHLTYAISQGDGFVEITGEVGTGKTTLCRVFLDSLSEKSEAAYIFNPKLDSIQLLKAINDDLNLDSSKDNIKDLIDVLNDFLLAKKKEKKTILLIIDEAQNLDPEVLEQLRLLSNLETSTSKLIQIILVGQPELTEKLGSYELRQLGQRITLSCHILPLTFEETCEYIRHRIHIASGHPVVKFDEGAFKAIYKYSKGVPRRINILCDRTLLTAFVLESRKVTGKIVKLAISELKGNLKMRRSKRIFAPVLSLAFCLLFVAFIYGLYVSDYFQNTKKLQKETVVKVFPVAATEKVGKIEPVQEPSLGQNLSLIEVLSDNFAEHSRRIALQTVLNLWTDNVVIKDESDFIEDDLTYFKLGAKQNGLVTYMAEEDFPFLLRLNLPPILEFSIPGYPNSIYMVCIKLDGDDVILTADNGKTVAMRQDQIDTYWTGLAYIPWKNFLGFMGTIPQNAPDESVISLKMLMRDIGYPDIPINSEYDEEAEAIVMGIQEKYGITVDGSVGALTKIALYNEAYSEVIPHIISNVDNSFNKRATKAALQPLGKQIEKTTVKTPDVRIEKLTTEITKIEPIVSDAFVEINISGENIEGNYNIFSIPSNGSNLARIVCDIACLRGVKTRGEKVVLVESNGVEKIRYFTYRGKMRVVVDVAEEKIKLLSYKSTKSEIVISVASGPREQKLKIADGEMEVREEGDGFRLEERRTETEKGSLM